MNPILVGFLLGAFVTISAEAITIVVAALVSASKDKKRDENETSRN